MRIVSISEKQQLLISIANGNEQAFRLLFDQYKHKLYSYAMHFTHSKQIAEEITQDIFLKIWINRRFLPGIDNIEAWIFTLARNLCFNQLKKLAHKRRMEESLLQTERFQEENVDQYISYKEQVYLLSRAIEELTPQQRVIFKLNREEGMTNAEIARRLNLSPNTVKTHMVGALRRIRSFFETHSVSFSLLLFLFSG